MYWSWVGFETRHLAWTLNALHLIIQLSAVWPTCLSLGCHGDPSSGTTDGEAAHLIWQRRRGQATGYHPGLELHHLGRKTAWRTAIKSLFDGFLNGNGQSGARNKIKEHRFSKQFINLSTTDWDTISEQHDRSTTVHHYKNFTKSIELSC